MANAPSFTTKVTLSTSINTKVLVHNGNYRLSINFEQMHA